MIYFDARTPRRCALHTGKICMLAEGTIKDPSEVREPYPLPESLTAAEDAHTPSKFEKSNV